MVKSRSLCKEGDNVELFSHLFSDELVFLNFDCKDRFDFFEKISAILMKKGFVTGSFRTAIAEREKKFPTGLRTLPYHVAIPHTDPEHIVKPFIAVIRPKRPIEFFEMGTDDQKLEVSILFLLGLKKSEKQTQLLSKLIEEVFMKQEVMEDLIKVSDESQLINLLKTRVM